MQPEQGPMMDQSATGTSAGATGGAPRAQGLYDPRNEHDACGVGFVAHIKGKKSHKIVEQGLQILLNLDHRGAVGADPLMGDGAASSRRSRTSSSARRWRSRA